MKKLLYLFTVCAIALSMVSCSSSSHLSSHKKHARVYVASSNNEAYYELDNNKQVDQILGEDEEGSENTIDIDNSNTIEAEPKDSVQEHTKKQKNNESQTCFIFVQAKNIK